MLDVARNPSSLRHAVPYDDLLPATFRWAARLPLEVQPRALMRAFPRIANDLGHAWRDAADFQRLVDDLLTDRRGGRRGFPPEVTEELLVLRDYWQGRLASRP
jgi:hypothetical protein